MKINAIIENKDGGTLVLDFPRSIYDVYEKLQSVGIRKSPHQINLSDEDGDAVRVKLYSEDEIGKHLFQRIKDYLQRNNMTQRQFLIGLIEDELERDQTERESQNEAVSDDPNQDEDDPEQNEDAALDDSEADSDEDEDESEDEAQGFTMGM